MADSPFSASVDVDKETNLVRISPFDDAHANLVWYIIPADTVHKLLHDRDGKGKTCLDLTDIQLTQEQLATVSPEIANRIMASKLFAQCMASEDTDNPYIQVVQREAEIHHVKNTFQLDSAWVHDNVLDSLESITKGNGETFSLGKTLADAKTFIPMAKDYSESIEGKLRKICIDQQGIDELKAFLDKPVSAIVGGDERLTEHLKTYQEYLKANISYGNLAQGENIDRYTMDKLTWNFVRNELRNKNFKDAKEYENMAETIYHMPWAQGYDKGESEYLLNSEICQQVMDSYTPIPNARAYVGWQQYDKEDDVRLSDIIYEDTQKHSATVGVAITGIMQNFKEGKAWPDINNMEVTKFVDKQEFEDVAQNRCSDAANGMRIYEADLEKVKDPKILYTIKKSFLDNSRTIL